MTGTGPLPDYLLRAIAGEERPLGVPSQATRMAVELLEARARIRDLEAKIEDLKEEEPDEK